MKQSNEVWSNLVISRNSINQSLDCSTKTFTAPRWFAIGSDRHVIFREFGALFNIFWWLFSPDENLETYENHPHVFIHFFPMNQTVTVDHMFVCPRSLMVPLASRTSEMWQSELHTKMELFRWDFFGSVAWTGWGFSVTPCPMRYGLCFEVEATN